MSRSFTRIRFGAAVVTAFVGGLVFASGFDFTRFGYAQQSGVVTKSVARTTSAPPAVSDLSNAFVDIAGRVTPAVVSIEAERDARVRRTPREQQQQQPQRRNVPPGLEDFFQQFDPRQQQGPAQASGSGFLVTQDGYILTNNHVVDNFDRVNVTLTDHRVFKAKVIGRDPTTDVAVIKIDAGNNLPVAAMGDDASLRVGEWVVAIGNPLGLDFTVTAGIVSAKGRSSTEMPVLQGNRYNISDFIQTDAAINPGNSGGPLVNIRGEVVGINSAIATGTGYYQGYGFAIPITLAKNVMDDIIKHGRVRRAVLGIEITEVQPEDAAVAGLKEIYGVKVGGFSGDESPGRRAGLEPGDVIIAADGKQTDRVSTLQRIIRAHEPGETVSVDVMRYGSKKSFRVKLAEAPTEEQVAADNDRADSTPAERGINYEKLGVTLEPVSAEFARANRLTDEQRGLRVVDVSPSGPARGKLIENDVILEIIYPTPRRPVRSAADLQSAMSKMKSGDYISLFVLLPRGQQQQTRVVNLRVE
jgi:serine protease Do